MRYTKVIAAKLKHHGVPHMEPDHFATIMNIVHLEGKLEGLNQKSNKHTNQDPYAYEKMKVQAQLDKLTGTVNPKYILVHIIG